MTDVIITFYLPRVKATPELFDKKHQKSVMTFDITAAMKGNQSLRTIPVTRFTRRGS
jgi:hypothetical protein